MALRTKTPRRPPAHHFQDPFLSGRTIGREPRLDRAAFEKLVEEALQTIPRQFKDRLENIAVIVEDLPSPETIRDLGLRSPYQLFGLYHGVPLDKRGSYYGNVPPDVVIIYQLPIENAFASEEEIREQVRETVIHEVGHFFGFSDAELRRIERENRKKKG